MIPSKAKRFAGFYLLLLAVVVSLAGVACGKAEEEPEKFDAAKYFSGKTIQIISGEESGGGGEVFMRVLAEILPDHFPGKPKIVVVNLPGAGGERAVREVMTARAADGLSITTISQTGGWCAREIFGEDIVGFDPETIKWVGSPKVIREPKALYVRRDGPTTWQELLKLGRTITTPSSRPGSGTALPGAFMEAVGLPVKVIYGYGGVAEQQAAFERGEFDMMLALSKESARRNVPHLIEKKFFVPLFWFVLPEPASYWEKELGVDPKTVPWMKDALGSSITDSQWAAFDSVMELDIMGDAYVLHPDTRKEVYEAWVAAYKAAVEDPRYVELVAAGGEPVGYAGPEALDKIYRDAKQLPQAQKEILKKVLGIQ